MRDNHHGGSFVRELFHDREDFLRKLRVQRGRRLVKKHDAGIRRDRAGDGHSLLLPSGQLRGIEGHLVLQTDPGQRVRRDLFRLLRRDFPHNRQARGYISERRLIGKEIIVLKDETCLFPVFADLVFADLPDVIKFVVQIQLPLIRHLEEIHAAQQRRLSRTAGAHDRHYVPRPDRQADPFQHLIVPEAFFDIYSLQHASHPVLSSFFSIFLCAKVRIVQMIM